MTIPRTPDRHVDTAMELDRHRARLLVGVGVEECRIDLAGVPTAVLEGGDGPPVVLLHGPGESAVTWRWIMPALTAARRVVAPDLPAHGSTGVPGGRIDEDAAVAWLAALVDQRCAGAPTLVGHVLGGALAARFAARHPDRVSRLVLVDSLGLAPFRPRLRFGLELLRFQAHPTEATYERFMDQCAHDLDSLRSGMGSDWRTFVAYNVGLARGDTAKAAGQLFRRVGLPRIPTRVLDRIDVPTTLIWGRHDKATPLRVAEQASARHGWPLHVIEDAADDPPRDQPEAFLEVLLRALGAP